MVVLLECEGGCKAKNRDAGQGRWMCRACQRKNLIFVGAVRSKVSETVIRLPDLRLAAGDKRQVALFVLAAVGIPQTAVAARAGVQQAHMNQVFNGLVKPQLHHMKAVMDLLREAGYDGYSEDELFYWGLPDTA